MATPGFFNDNQYRDYPFQFRVTPLIEDGWSSHSSYAADELQQSLIVDCGVILYPDSNFEGASGDYVYLHSIRRHGNVLQIMLMLSHLPGYPLTFNINTSTARQFTTVWVDSSQLVLPFGSIDSCNDIPVWEGYIVFGDTADMLNSMSDGDIIAYPPGLWTLLPGRIQNLCATQVQSVVIANIPRTTVTPSANCTDDIDDITADYRTAVVVADCIIGDIGIHPGYNCNVRQNANENAIYIGASPGAGEGQPCEEYQLYPDEEKPDGSQLYSGGPACQDIVRYINGAAGPDIVIKGGAGFRVTTQADLPHTVIITRVLESFNVCGDAVLDDLLSSSDTSASMEWLHI